jgi:uncharacterized protein HemX
MDLFELELERRLARREPAEDFSARTMARIREEAEGSPAAAWGRGDRTKGQRTKTWSWALTGALAASLAVGAFVQNRRVERQAAEEAETQLFEALFVTGEKIQIARQRAGGGDAPGGN